MASWRRNTFAGFDLSPNFNWEDAIGAGNSYIRYHIRWGFNLDAPVTTDIQGVCNNLISFGLATTIGNGTEARPNAKTQAWPDQDPPTQRWVYWETLAPVVTAIDYQANVITFRNSQSTELTDSKGQVLATGLPAGDTLNLSSCWAYSGPFDDKVNTQIWVSLSIARKN